MKRLLFVLLFGVIAALSKSMANVSSVGVLIPLTVTWNDPSGGNNDFPKAPIQPPSVYLDGHSLYFGNPHSEAVPVELADATGNVVYSDYLPAGTQTLSLPATLSGTYTLFIYIGNYVFAGQINL